MKIRLNGEEKEVGSATRLNDLLKDVGISTRGIAVELNRQVLPSQAWRETVLKEGDVLEIVRFIGGG